MQKSRIKALFIGTLWLLAAGFGWGCAELGIHPLFSTARADTKNDASTAKAPETVKVPLAVFREITYDFKSAVEGTEIKHDFVIENHGKAPLLITRIDSDCYCLVASNPETIPAGGKDKISVVLNTDEKGGGALVKHFKVTTNDTKAALTDLTVTGKVTRVIKTLPWKVEIVGRKGDDLSKQVHITPLTDQLFTLQDIKADYGSGKHFSWDLKPLGEKPSKSGYMLTVTCNSQDTGRSYGYIKAKTGLKGRPTIGISVSCNVLEKPAKLEEPAKKDEQKSTK